MKKIICTISQIRTNYVYTFTMMDIDKNVSKVNSFEITVLITKIASAAVDPKYFFQFIDEKKDLIKEKLTEFGFEKAPIIVAMNISDFFMEITKIPKISSKETMKTYAVEMNNLYLDFKKNYVTSMISFDLSKTMRSYVTLCCFKVVYQRLIAVLHRLKNKIEDILFLPDALRNILIKQKMINVKAVQNYVFINIGERETTFFVAKNKSLANYRNYEVGIKDMLSYASVVRDTLNYKDQQEGKVILRSDDALNKKAFAIVFKELLNDLTSALGYYDLNDEALIFINADSFNNVFFVEAFNLKIKGLNIIPIVMKEAYQTDFVNYGLFYNPKIKREFVLPLKVK